MFNEELKPHARGPVDMNVCMQMFKLASSSSQRHQPASLRQRRKHKDCNTENKETGTHQNNKTCLKISLSKDIEEIGEKRIKIH